MSKKYSVIIPVYNKAKYLDECVRSVIAQPYDNMEILLINDGSVDDSLNICKKYEKIDSRVIVYDKPNTGVSDTRNFGIQKACGEYLIFIDADDILAEGFIAIIDKNICNYDILLYRSCRDKKLLGDINKFNRRLILDNYQDEIIKSVLYNRKLIYGCRFNFNRVTDYVVSTKLIKKNNLRFNSKLKIGEDKIFNFVLFQKTRNIAYVDYCLYYIRTNKESVMGSYNKNAFSINELLYQEFEKEIGLIQDEHLQFELRQLISCLRFQVVLNSITSDYCHRDNKEKYADRKSSYAACRSYLDNEAKRFLNNYERYLLSVFQYPYLFMEVIMKHRLLRGAWYYFCYFFSNIKSDKIDN